jgi:hypothetical protein
MTQPDVPTYRARRLGECAHARSLARTPLRCPEHGSENGQAPPDELRDAGRYNSLCEVRAAVPLLNALNQHREVASAGHAHPSLQLQAGRVANGNRILTGRLSLKVPVACRHGCGAGLREFPGRGAQSVTGSARAPVTLCTFPPEGSWAAHVANGNRILTERLSLKVLSAYPHGCGAGLRNFSG